MTMLTMSDTHVRRAQVTEHVTLVNVRERSVRATHDFLAEAGIVHLRPTRDKALRAELKGPPVEVVIRHSHHDPGDNQRAPRQISILVSSVVTTRRSEHRRARPENRDPPARGPCTALHAALARHAGIHVCRYDRRRRVRRFGLALPTRTCHESGIREAFARSHSSNDWTAGLSARASSGERWRRNASPRIAWCSYMLPMSSAPGKPSAR